MKIRIYFSVNWHDSSSPCPWALCDESGTVIRSECSALSEIPKAEEYIAIVAASRFTCVSVPMPAKAKRRWESALPFVAEEYTLTDPEENHVVPGGIQNDGQRSLFIVDKQWLKSLLAACLEAHISLRRVLPEILLPNLPENSWVVVLEGNQGFMRTAAYSGIALDNFDTDHPPLALTLSFNNALPFPPQKIEIRYALNSITDEGVLPRWENLPTAAVLGEPWDWKSAPIANNTLNFLWGEFAPKAKLHEWLWKLRPVLWIILAALVIETVGLNLEWLLLSQEKKSVIQNMEKTFRKTFGESTSIVNPALQMQRNITSLRHSVGVTDDADFLPLLDQVSNTLSELPAGSITGLHYEAGRLDMEIKLHSATEIRTLQQRLLNKGLYIRVGEIRESEGSAEAKLAIQPGGGA